MHRLAVARIILPGIHQDLAELTSIVLVGRRNLTPESGGNRVWALDQPCGKPSPRGGFSLELEPRAAQMYAGVAIVAHLGESFWRSCLRLSAWHEEPCATDHS